VASVASRIIEALAPPFRCEDHQFVITPSIGVAMYPEDGETSDELLMNADSAMYRAKAAGRNNCKFFSGTMKIRSQYRVNLENDLRQAIDEEHFELYYQPKVDTSSGVIVGAEALLRWKHAERGWISPADFIPIAEETGLILPLGRWVLQEACRQLAEWQHSQLGQIPVSVNISSQQMYADDLVAIVKSAVSDSGIGAELLELEITESLLMRDIEATIDALNALKEFGVDLSVDDFGTGYSSLSYLKRFPIDILKIDRSFVKDLHRDPDDASICAAIIAMAHSLDLKVIAEGVELEEQLAYLRDHNCDQIQGFLFSKPLPAKEFEALVTARPDSRQKVAIPDKSVKLFSG
jgi:EAL domain-containing protein (putative c-di-GMP-specific phosphodiesterase class I)